MNGKIKLILLPKVYIGLYNIIKKYEFWWLWHSRTS